MNEISNIDDELRVVPDFMQEDKGAGLEDVQRFIVPPRIIVTQPQSNAPLDKYPKGSVVVMPHNQCLAMFDVEENCLSQLLVFVPIFYWIEYVIENPRSLRDKIGSVRERTYDHGSEIARKAANAKLRDFPCPEDTTGKLFCTHVTRLNYMLAFLNKESQPIIAGVHTFKKGEQKTGMNLNSLITARNKAPIYGCKFVADVSLRTNDQGKWYGFDIKNPPKDIGAWVTDAELYNEFKEQHEKFAEAMANNLLRPEEEEEFAGQTVDGSATEEEPEF